MIQRTTTVAFLLLLSASAEAQLSGGEIEDESGMINRIPGLDIEARFGLGWELGDHPVAVTALVRNNTDQTIEGRFQLVDRWGSHEMDLGEAYLAPGQVRRFCWIRKCDDYLSAQLEFVQNRKVIQQRNLNQMSANVRRDRHLVGIVHDGSSQLDFAPDFSPRVSQEVQFSEYDNESIEYSEAGFLHAAFNLRTWQIPDHFGPLEPLSVLIILDSVSAEVFNDAQYEAMANWVAVGGQIYLPVKSQKFVQELELHLPFLLSPAVNDRFLAVRRCGLGQVILYTGSLFRGDSGESDLAVYRSIVGKTPVHPQSATSLTNLPVAETYGRNTTRAALTTYFVGYLILCAIPLAFITAKWKRRVFPYTVGLIVCGCIAATAVAATLRNCAGEARWLTLTVPGENGAIQYADLEVRSTGGIGGAVRVSGVQPDLQAGSPTPTDYYYGWHYEEDGLMFPPFDYQPSGVEDEASYEVQAEITPWGTQRLRATDFLPGVEPPEVSVTIQRNRKRRAVRATLEIENGSVPVKNVRLNIVYARKKNDKVDSCEMFLGDLSERDSLQTTVDLYSNGELGFRPFHEYRETVFPLPTIPETARVILSGQLVGSPSLELDEQFSDFRLDHEGHFWLYEVPTERMQFIEANGFDSQEKDQK